MSNWTDDEGWSWAVDLMPGTRRFRVTTISPAPESLESETYCDEGTPIASATPTDKERWFMDALKNNMRRVIEEGRKSEPEVENKKGEEETA